MKSILNLWEPRIYVLSIPIDYDDSSITMTINYTIPALNDEADSFVYSVSK